MNPVVIGTVETDLLVAEVKPLRAVVITRHARTTVVSAIMIDVTALEVAVPMTVTENGTEIEIVTVTHDSHPDRQHMS